MIKVGLIQGVHGLHGEVKVLSLTDYPQRFKKGERFSLSRQTGLFTVETLRRHGDVFLVKFQGVEERETARGLVGAYLEIADEEAMPLPEGRFYHFQLIGLHVYERDVLLGELTEIIETAANDVYVVTGDQEKPLLIPALKSIVQTVDVAAGRMDVALPPGLLEAR